GDDCTIDVVAASSWEMSQPITYTVECDGDVVVPETVFYYRSPSDPMPEFEIVRAGEVVGLVDRRAPTALVVMYHHTSGESWPRGQPDDSIDDRAARRTRLLKAFNDAHARGGFTAEAR